MENETGAAAKYPLLHFFAVARGHWVVLKDLMEF
jgi:hypothetical protein